jgi:5'-methylthioadenosine phosphorylase
MAGKEASVAEIRIGVIGGSGLYQIEGLHDVQQVRVNTPFGETSDAITVGELEGTGIAFLPRHGKGHRINPSEIPVRANVYALKSLGVKRIISVSAVGSLKEDIRPLDLVIPDQLIDRTRSRVNTFFGNGLVAHVGFAEPFCPVLSHILFEAAGVESIKVHRGGTGVVMEGPLFSTRAESMLYRSWGASVVGMTALPEAKLAREAEICYATLAFVTDYDCWHQSEKPVTVEEVVANLFRSAAVSKSILKRAVPMVPAERKCSCPNALRDAIITAPEHIPTQVKKELALLIGKYLK